jgi:hypothetical protein
MKGISVVERHFEKAATLLVAVSVFGYLAWDFLSPTTFKMGSKSDVTPATANEILLQKALSVQKQQSGENTLEFEPIQKGVTQEAFTQKLNSNISAPDRLSANAPSLAKKILLPDVRSLDTWYYEPRFSAPTMVSPVEWFGDALEAESTSKNEALQKFLASQSDANSLDVIWTRPVAHVDLKAIRNELVKEEKSANPPRLATVSEWRKNAIYFLDVVFERQEQKDDGSWSDPVVVPAMFGFEGKLFRDKKDLDSNKIFASMRGEKSIEKAIRQPDFYPSLHGSGKIESSTNSTSALPATAQGDKKKQQITEKKKEDLQTKEKELAPLEKELQILGGDWTQQKEDARKADAKKEAERKRKENKNNSNTVAEPPVDLKIPQWKKITKDVITLRKIIKDLKSDLGIESEAPVDSKAEKSTPKQVEVDPDFIDVWTHDLQAPLGKTLRYRCHIDIYNPFFGKERQLVEKQKPLAKNPMISTAVSEWSSPVRVPRKAMYFAENGTIETNVAGSKSAVFFNVYVLKNGFWQKTDPNPSFEPGQPLIFPLTFKEKLGEDKNPASSNEIDSGWFVVDVVDDPNASPEKNRATLPGVVISRRDGTEKLEIRYPTLQKQDPDQTKLKNLVEEAKSAKPLPNKAG